MGTINSNNINSLYNDYNPAFDNLYTVEISTYSSSGKLGKGLDSKGTSGTRGEELNLIGDYIKLHATAVQFNGESLQLERNEVTKNFQLSDNAYTRTDTLSITWRESDEWIVKKYHDEWLSLFYNKEGDHYWSYPRTYSSTEPNINVAGYVSLENKDIYRRFVITLPINKGGNSSSRYFENKVTFEYVLPNSSGGLNLGWKSKGDVVSHQMNYYVTKWEMSREPNYR